MELTATQNRISVSALPDQTAQQEVYRPKVEAPALAFQLGAWLGGLESFFLTEQLSVGKVTDFTRPLLVSRSALQRASHLCFLLTDAMNRGAELPGIDPEEVRSLHSAIRKPLGLCDPMIAAGKFGQDAWTAWHSSALTSLLECPTYSQLVATTESNGVDFLPKKLRTLLSEKLSVVQSRDLESVLPRFGTILRLLDLVGEMLERDEPLKSSLIIFSKTSERIRELIEHLNQLVKRSGEEPEGIFGVFDSASYMTSIELKKVLNQELFGVVTIRPATTVYARNETAYALLTESFQQILAQFARHVDPDVDIFDLFPSFKSKLEQSIILRHDLHSLAATTRDAEKSGDVKNVEKLNAELNRFMDKTVRFLFYKDVETFERFVEEILANKDQKDLTALLHRFAAYSETLFGQVSLRAVLEHHPFDPNEN